MKKILNKSLLSMAVSLAGLNFSQANTSAYTGRIIEFKSGANGFDTRTFFYEGESEVIAFDTQFTNELAEQAIQHLRTYTKKPISWLVITHPNPDKFNGSAVYKKEGAKILTSKSTADAIPEVHAYKEYYFVEMAKMFKKGDYPQPVAIDQTFQGKMDLILKGGEKIQLSELNHPGVSSTQTVAYISSLNSLMVGDLIHYKSHAWLEGGIVKGKPNPTIEQWIQNLNELGKLFSENTKVYGGRGETTTLKKSIPEQVSYLKGAKELIRQEIKSLGKKANEFQGPNAGELYKSLALKFQKKFPDYGLVYMIEYGSYGLVQSELSK